MTRLAARSAARGMLLLLLAPIAVRAEEPVPPASPDAPQPPAREANADSALESRWSVTAIGQYTAIPSPEDSDKVGGWFDQYEYTPNKGSDFPFQLGIRDARFDLFRGDTALFQSRLESPTSNLGISGSDIDDPFYNQRLEALTRLPGFALDLSYRRIRTEQLRIFPNTAGPGLVFQDQTRQGQRFFRDRTGFQAEGRLSPFLAFPELAEGAAGETSRLRPQLSLRGGYEARGGTRQLRIHRGPSNEWLGLADGRDRSVADVGAGLLVAPDGLFTLSLDFDHQRFRTDSGIPTEGDLGYPPPESQRTVGFIPETDRNTGTLRATSRIGDRAVVEAGFLVSQLEQVSPYTPRQRSFGLKDNHVRYYGARLATDIELLPALSFNGFFKLDRRENDIDRDTALFDSVSQIDPFVKHWQRIATGAELTWRFGVLGRAAVGTRYDETSRDLKFGSAGTLRVLPANTVMDRDSQLVSLYARGSVRPLRALRLAGEIGYRWAPETGYATELNDNLYGELHGSYVFDLSRPVVVSAYLRGGTGDNEDFRMVSGQGPVPTDAVLPRSYERSNFVTGFTTSVSPVDRITTSVSFFYGRDDQDVTFDRSTLQRYWQDVVPLEFTRDGRSRFESKQTSVVVAVHAALDEKTDAALGYSFTRAEADYSGSDDTPSLELLKDARRVDSDVHGIDLELRHRLMKGLELLAGYRVQRYNEKPDAPVSDDSSARPFGHSTYQHTVTVGVTIDSEFFAN